MFWFGRVFCIIVFCVILDKTKWFQTVATIILKMSVFKAMTDQLILSNNVSLSFTLENPKHF